MRNIKKIIKSSSFLENNVFSLRYRLRELLFSKAPGHLEKEVIPFPESDSLLNTFDDLPDLKIKFTKIDLCNSYSFNGLFIDLVDFYSKTRIRYKFSVPYMTKMIKRMRCKMPKTNLPKNFNYYFFFFDYGNFRIPHTAHISPDGYLMTTNTYYIAHIDTNTDKITYLPENYDKELWLYNAMGGFSADYKYYYFVRWPYQDFFKIRKDHANRANAQLGRIHLETKKTEILSELAISDLIHQIVTTKDDRYVVFVTFSHQSIEKYPDVWPHEAPEAYKKCTDAGIKLGDIVTYDLKTGKHWEVQLPIPCLAHAEFDPGEPYVMYASAHNFCYHWIGNYWARLIPGPGGIYKLRIKDEKTEIEGLYTDDDFFRVTQHQVFSYKGKTLIVATTTVYRLVIIDAETMTVWRKIKYGVDPLPNPKKYGVTIVSEEAPPTICVSDDSRYIVLGLTHKYLFYDIENDKMLDCIIHLGKRGRGHAINFYK